MAYIYPYAGHNRNTVTTNNADNQPITPPHYQNQVVRSDKAYPFKSLQSILSSLPNHCRAFAILALLLLATGSAHAQYQCDWRDGRGSTQYYDMCGNRADSPASLTSCTACGDVWHIYDNNNREDRATYRTFKAPAGCKLRVTLNSSSFGNNGNNKYDHMYVKESTAGTTGTNTDNPACNWYFGHTTPSSYTTTNTGSYVTLYFLNQANNQDSRFDITIECIDCIECDESFNMSTTTRTIECGTTYCFYDDGGPTGNYNRNRNQSLTLNSDGLITIQFLQFATYNNNDYLTVRDGNGTATILINQAYGTTLPATVTTTGHTMTIQWRADNVNNTQAAGWVAIITASGCTPSCTDPAFDNCPDELESGTTWNPHWNTSATPTGWTTSNASYSAGTVTAGSTIGNASVSATVVEDMPYCAGTLSCTFNVVCNTSRSLTLSSASGTVVAGNDITATITNTTGQNITWSSDNTGIATASQSGNTLTIHGVSAGQTTLRGRINQYTTGGVTYCAQDVTYNVTVTAPATTCDGTETTVGNGSDYFSTYGPVYNYWEYGYRQIIYDPEDDDICGGTISKIAFNYYSGTSFTRNPVTIYMGESPKEAFQSTSDWITDLSGFTTVYQGSLSFTTTGWQWINLQNTFNYSGQDNLVVIIKDDNGSYGSSYYFYTHTTTGNRQIYAYDDDAYNTANPGTAYDVTNYRPDTKFCIDCCTDWDADFHYTTTSASIVAGTSYTNTTLVNNTAYNVSYTISPSMAGVSISSSGEVTTPANIEQTFTVTATIQRGGEYCDKKTTYTLDVGDGCNKIGNGSTQIDGPIVPGYRNSYMEMIYTYSEIGEYCRISRIAFNYKQTGTVSRHLKIYMTQDSKSEFDNRGDFIGSNNMTLVWEGDWTFSEGWNVFELTTPFDYTSGNIIIGVNSHASYYERSTGFNGESDDYNRVLSSFYGPEEITSDHMDTWCTNHSSYYEINYYRPNIKFCMDCCNLEAEIQFGDPEP